MRTAVKKYLSLNLGAWCKIAKPRVTIKKTFLLTAALFPASLFASLGPFEHGAGIKAMGAGGVSYVFAQEATALSANPAHAATLGNRYDIGMNVMMLNPDAAVQKNAFEDDSTHESRRFWAAIPQFGYNRDINEKWSFGVTVLQAGVGPKYKKNPYGRFGGGNQASLKLGAASVATVLSYKASNVHSFGAGLVIGYQFLSIRGLKFLTSEEPERRVSVAPDQVTNKGKEDAFNVGFTLGWRGQVSDTLSLGAGYRSKGWAQKLDAYRGLLPEGGRLELPPVYGVGAAFTPVASLSLALEWQRYEYSKVKAFSNPIGKLESGNLLGSGDGPGFGWQDQDNLKFGIKWQTTPETRIRLGYVYSDVLVEPSETFFAALAPGTMREHFTAGFTTRYRDYEVSVAVSFSPENDVNGRESIPSMLGGGEMNVNNDFYSFGLSLGRTF